VAPERVSWPVRVALALAGVALALVTAEAGLRLSGFHFDFVPALQFGWPDPVALREAYVTDPDLVWVTREYRDVLREARRTHPGIVFMGDSCTEFGTYPSRTVKALERANAPVNTGVKLGVGGWTTEQGLVQLRRDVIPLHPRVITIYYGWNDHWKALGPTDPQIMRARRLRALADHLRLAQGWLKLGVAMAARQTPAPNRVPLPRYIDNLRAFSTEARAAGIVPVFVTAPSNHVPGHEPEYLAKRHVRTLAELVPLHTAYLEATRTVARDTGAVLCDAAASFAALPAPHDRYFQKDGIHLTEAGDDEMAKELASCIAAAK